MGTIPESVEGLILVTPIISIMMSVIVGVVWIFYMRKVGGYVGLFCSLAITALCSFIICGLHYLTVNSMEEIRFWGLFSLACLFSTCLFFFLTGEYATSDQPISWRVILVGCFSGMIYGALLLSIAPDYASTLIYAINLGESGWVWQVSPIFLAFLAFFLTGTLGFFAMFCATIYRAEESSPFKISSQRFVVSLAIGLPIIIAISIVRLFYANLDLMISTIQIISTVGIVLEIFSSLIKEPRLIYLQPHKPIALFIVDTAGTVHFTHQFGINRLMTSAELFAPAITAINSIVQQSLKLDQLEGIQEFSTDEHSFLLHLNSKLEMIGVLLVPKPTQMVRKALARLMNHLGSIWQASYTNEIIPAEEPSLNKLIIDCFPFCAPRQKKATKT